MSTSTLHSHIYNNPTLQMHHCKHPHHRGTSHKKSHTMLFHTTHSLTYTLTTSCQLLISTLAQPPSAAQSVSPLQREWASQQQDALCVFLLSRQQLLTPNWMRISCPLRMTHRHSPLSSRKDRARWRQPCIAMCMQAYRALRC